MARVTRPRLVPVGRVLLGTGRAGAGGLSEAPPTIWSQEAPRLVVRPRPAADRARHRPVVPKPTTRRSLLNGSIIRSVTDARAVPPPTVPPAARNMVAGLRTLTQVRPPSSVLYTAPVVLAPLAATATYARRSVLASMTTLTTR